MYYRRLLFGPLEIIEVARFVHSFLLHMCSGTMTSQAALCSRATNFCIHRFDIANVTISVTNLNDNPPLFVDEGDIVDSIDVQVPEEIPSPYTIETLQVFQQAQSV